MVAAWSLTKRMASLCVMEDNVKRSYQIGKEGEGARIASVRRKADR